MDQSELVKKLVPLIEKFKNNPHLELEGSIGVFSESFKSGVDFNYFKTLCTSCSVTDNKISKSKWSKIESSSHFASYFFKNSVRGRYGVKEKPEFVRKVPISKIDLVCPERSYDIRINLKEEKPIQNYLAKDTPEYVRLHERWSFTYKDAFRYDFSKVVSGNTKENACKKAPVYEIELEVLRNHAFLDSISNEQLAVHIVEKLVDLLGRYDANYKPLPYTLTLGQVWNSPSKEIGMF